MIIYDLICENGHKFEGWFEDRNTFENQKSVKMITCPVCTSVEVAITPSSVAIKDSRTPDRKANDLHPIKAFKMLHEYLNKNFTDVGDNFAEVALKIHHGEEDKKNIKGTTTEREEETLREEGVQFFKIPVPKFDS